MGPRELSAVVASASPRESLLDHRRPKEKERKKARREKREEEREEKREERREKREERRKKKEEMPAVLKGLSGERETTGRMKRDPWEEERRQSRFQSFFRDFSWRVQDEVTF